MFAENTTCNFVLDVLCSRLGFIFFGCFSLRGEGRSRGCRECFVVLEEEDLLLQI